MINITDSVARRRWVAEMDRQMTILEAGYIRRLTPLLNRQFKDAADFVSHGMIDSSDQAVDSRMKDQVILLTEHYKRVATVFSNKAYKIIEKSKFVSVPEIKAPLNEFWREIDTWASTQAAQKIRKIQKTTKSNIAKIIQVGMKEGESHRDIAKRITKTSATINPYRARTIALTETHTAAVKSIDSAVKSTRIEMEREWVAAKDMRTRRRGKGFPFDHWVADGERTSQDGKFTLTGEALEFPGDPKGSPGNIIRCRCVLLYHAIRAAELSKPYVPELEPEPLLDFSSMGVGSINTGEFSASVGKKIEEEFQTHLSGVFARSPKLAERVSGQIIKTDISVSKGKVFYGTLEKDGQYFNHKIQINGLVDKKDTLKIGKSFHVAEDRLSILRHEYGHYSYDELLTFPEKKMWTELHKTKGNAWFKKNLSEYGGTNGMEAFAESFSAYTSPKYKMGMLPKEVESYFEGLLGKRKVGRLAVKPELEGVLGRISIGSPVKSADEILKHFEDSSKATFIEGKSAANLKEGISNRLGQKMFDLKSVEMDSFVRFLENTDASSLSSLYYKRAANDLIRQWAATSGDSNPKSIMMQLAAKVEFKLEGTTLWWDPRVLKEAEELFKIHEKAARQFIRMMYENTQEHLKKLGLKTVKIARGYKHSLGDGGLSPSIVEKPLQKVKIQLQPMSSFSTDMNEARSFTDGGGIKSMLFVEVPVDRILSTPVTGFGCMDEMEFVVLGSQKEAETVLRATISADQFEDGFWSLFEIHKKSNSALLKRITEEIHKATKQ